MYLAGRKLVTGSAGCVSFFFYTARDARVLMRFSTLVECTRFYPYRDSLHSAPVDIGYSHFHVPSFSELFR